VSPSVVRSVALAAVVCYVLLMVTGGAVRLTGSGLGCPDWPSCYQHQLTAHVSFHPMVEFLNRLVTVAVTIVSALALLVALARSPRRRDLCWLGGGLVAGVVAQIILGGIVVLFKLNPYLVACHFLLTIVVLANAVVFFHRSCVDAEHDEDTSVSLVPSDLRWLARCLLGALGIVSCVGTMVAGAGPHAGAPSTPTQPIERIPIAFKAIAEAHSDVAIFLIGLTFASLFAFHRAKVPARVQQRLRWVFELLVLQGTLGYVQFAPVVVEFHILGVATLWVAAVGFYLTLHDHPRRQAMPTAAANGALALDTAVPARPAVAGAGAGAGAGAA
jgi:cytochrome c oxidase assembly protein subunit 15